MLELKNITAVAGKKTILKDISYMFERGNIYAIMGPNGSGKSTLANVIMGHPNYKLSLDAKIKFNGEDITELDTYKRSQKGVFLSFQHPMELSGVTAVGLLTTALSGKKDALEINKDVQKAAKELKISKHLLDRSLNESASGGERKKMELLQAAILNPSVYIFDEIDTGVDVDALKDIANFLNNNKKDKIFIIITHYYRILEYIKPDRVLVIDGGKLIGEGGSSLAMQIEKEGYESMR